MFNYTDRYNLMSKQGNKDYILSFWKLVDEIVHVNKLCKEVIVSSNTYGNRACYLYKQDIVLFNPYTRSFQPDYMRMQYKTFGGVKDLTPGGVLCHELGHALSNKQPQIVFAFKTIRLSDHNFVTSYAKTSVYEDIAESFRLFCTNPKTLKKVSVNRYEALLLVSECFIK